MSGERCPSCGLDLGRAGSVRYKGRLTIVPVLGEDEDGHDVVLSEHVCGDDAGPPP
jgi:hypothetical protein